MSQYVDYLGVPSNIQWCKADELVGSTVSVVSNDTNTLYLAWDTWEYAYQMQYRTRYRLTLAETRANNGSAEQWSDWTDWQGSDLTQDTALFVQEQGQRDGVTVIAALDAYNFKGKFGALTDADKWQVEVRVRTFDIGKAKHSLWCSAVLNVVFDPDPTVAVTINADNTLTFTYTSDYQRTMYITKTTVYKWYNSAKTGGSSNTRIVTHTLNAYVKSYTVGYWTNTFLQTNTDYDVVYELRTKDGFVGTYTRTIQFTKGGGSATVTAPTLDIKINEKGRLAIVANGSYDAMYGQVSFTTAQGADITQDLDFSVAAKYGAAVYLYPPIGREMAIRVVGVKDGSYATTTTTYTIDAKDAAHSGAWWNYNNQCVRAYLKESGDAVDDDYTLEADTIKTIGRQRPIARYGTGGTRSLTASCVFLRGELESHNPEYAESWALERLHAKHSWVFRTSTGRWHRVVVTGISITDNSSEQYISADISMEEVEGLGEE